MFINRLIFFQLLRLDVKFFKLKYDPYFQPIPVMQKNYGISLYFSNFSSLKRAAHTLDRALRAPGWERSTFLFTTWPRLQKNSMHGQRTIFKPSPLVFVPNKNKSRKKNYLNGDTWLQNRSRKHVNFTATCRELMENSCAIYFQKTLNVRLHLCTKNDLFTRSRSIKPEFPYWWCLPSV